MQILFPMREGARVMESSAAQRGAVKRRARRTELERQAAQGAKCAPGWNVGSLLQPRIADLWPAITTVVNTHVLFAPAAATYHAAHLGPSTWRTKRRPIRL
jgi:hypothetical protein